MACGRNICHRALWLHVVLFEYMLQVEFRIIRSLVEKTYAKFTFNDFVNQH